MNQKTKEMVKFDDDLLENLLLRKTLNNENQKLSFEFKKWQERQSKAAVRSWQEDPSLINIKILQT